MCYVGNIAKVYLSLDGTMFVIASGLKIEHQQTVKVLWYPMIKSTQTTLQGRSSAHVVGKRERNTTM